MPLLRKLRLLFCVLLIPLSLVAQLKTAKHKYYTVTYSVPDHMPVLVKYILRDDMVDCQDKRVSWKTDPQIPESNVDNDYTTGCGYEKGHNMPHKDNSCDPDGIKECFYYSNCFPQTKKLNGGVWGALENRERDYATEYGKVKVFIGHIGKKKETLGKNKIAIPLYCWKVIYVNKRFEAYIFPNTTTVSGKPDDFMEPGNLRKIEDACDLNFIQLVASLRN